MQVVDLNTNHPDLPNTTRKAVVLETYSNHRSLFSTLVVEIQNFKNGVLMTNIVGKPYEFALRADNSTLVDPATGDYVPEGTIGAIGEYDYIQYLESIVVPFSTQSFKQNVILRAESLGRFDI